MVLIAQLAGCGEAMRTGSTDQLAPRPLGICTCRVRHAKRTRASNLARFRKSAARHRAWHPVARGRIAPHLSILAPHASALVFVDLMAVVEPARDLRITTSFRSLLR
jgi:hypothetical protein